MSAPAAVLVSLTHRLAAVDTARLLCRYGLLYTNRRVRVDLSAAEVHQMVCDRLRADGARAYASDFDGEEAGGMVGFSDILHAATWAARQVYLLFPDSVDERMRAFVDDFGIDEERLAA